MEGQQGMLGQSAKIISQPPRLTLGFNGKHCEWLMQLLHEMNEDCKKVFSLGPQPWPAYPSSGAMS